MDPRIGTNKNKFLENITPIKLTEARNLKLHTACWGLLTDYSLESVKVNADGSGNYTSSATIRIGDISGQITCLIKGPSIGLLFGLTHHKWKELEKLCGHNAQLFYRYFKDGLRNNFSYEQKLFYYFCASNQKKDVLVAFFHRVVNSRNRDKNDAFLQIIELRTLEKEVLSAYQKHLNKNV